VELVDVSRLCVPECEAADVFAGGVARKDDVQPWAVPSAKS